MKIIRYFSTYIQQWSGTLRLIVTIISIAITIVLFSSILDRSSVVAQSKPSSIKTSITSQQITSGRTIKVVTRVISPFVTEDRGELGGFSIELWKQIAQKLDLKSDFIKSENVEDLLNTIKEQRADVGIAAISVTAKREQDFDFSQPIFESGLQILVRTQAQKNSIGQLFTSIFTPTLFQLLGIMMLIILIPAHIVWLVERRHQGGFLENSAYFPGIFKACWWAAATLATQAEEMPKSPLGRVMALVWMFISVVFIAYFTATVTTSLTIEQLQSSIKSPSDLPGKKIATISGSTSANYLKQEKIGVKEFQQIDEAYKVLENGEVDAVVFDAPILLYYAAHDGKGKVQVVGSIFRKESYAIALPNGSPYRKSISKALLSLQEKGTYQQIYDKWFTSK